MYHERRTDDGGLQYTISFAGSHLPKLHSAWCLQYIKCEILDRLMTSFQMCRLREKYLCDNVDVIPFIIRWRSTN